MSHHGSLAVNLLHHVALHTGQLPKNREEHSALIHKMLLFAGWGQALLGFGFPAVAAAAALAWYVRKRRLRRQFTEKKPT